MHGMASNLFNNTAAKYSETCLERPLPFEITCLTHHPFLAEGPWHFSITEPVTRDHAPVLTDHIFVANVVVFQERFYCSVINMING